MTVKELRNRLYCMDDDAAVELLTCDDYNIPCGSDTVKEIIVMQFGDGEEKSTRVVLMV